MPSTGLTTSGLARIVDLLDRLGSKILICEEAGEVLEAHTLTALLPTIEHAIFIGDHLQLRPSIQNYELQSDNPHGRPFSLDVSLFERLVRPEVGLGLQVPFSTLWTQRRMHPSISTLVRSTLYPHLEDVDAVSQYPEVAGMRQRLYWLDHRHGEVSGQGDEHITTSHSNHFEVEMTAALVSHLVKQGIYKPADIAVLTPYLGQLRKLRKCLENILQVTMSDRDVADLEADGAVMRRTMLKRLLESPRRRPCSNPYDLPLWTISKVKRPRL